jgi:hypothetical protein
MTYHAPELLLVGAAQNVVLADSTLSHKEPGICKKETVPPEVAPFYDPDDVW